MHLFVSFEVKTKTIKMKTKFTLTIGVFLILQSCSFYTPEDYFDRTTFNINQFQLLGKVDIDQIKMAKENNSMHSIIDGKPVITDDCVQFLKTWKLLSIENDIAKIKELKPTNDTKEMINRSLDLFNFVKERYETDYVEMAKLLNEKANDSIVNNAIAKFEKEQLPIVDAKIQNLLEVALPYAKNNNIPVTLKD